MEVELRKIFEDRSELVVNFTKSFLIPLPKDSAEFKSSQRSFDGGRFNWITDHDPYVSHTRFIDSGDTAEVHEVRFRLMLADE
jgi:hypothetical protein